MIYNFGPFSVDAAAYRLTQAGDVVPLSPKIIDLLLYLVARPSTLGARGNTATSDPRPSADARRARKHCDERPRPSAEALRKPIARGPVMP